MPYIYSPSRPVFFVIFVSSYTAYIQHTLCVSQWHPCVVFKLGKCLPVILVVHGALPLVPLLPGVLQCTDFPNAEEISFLLTKTYSCPCKLYSMIVRALPYLVMSIAQGQSICTSHIKQNQCSIGGLE